MKRLLNRRFGFDYFEIRLPSETFTGRFSMSPDLVPFMDSIDFKDKDVAIVSDGFGGLTSYVASKLAKSATNFEAEDGLLDVASTIKASYPSTTIHYAAQNFRTRLKSHHGYPEKFDVVLLTPRWHGGFKTSDKEYKALVESAFDACNPDGVVLFVCKRSNYEWDSWPEKMMRSWHCKPETFLTLVQKMKPGKIQLQEFKDLRNRPYYAVKVNVKSNVSAISADGEVSVVPKVVTREKVTFAEFLEDQMGDDFNLDDYMEYQRIFGEKEPQKSYSKRSINAALKKGKIEEVEEGVYREVKAGG